MSRKQQLRELQSAEAVLEERRLKLHRAARSRRDHLQRVHPAWLLAVGFTTGVVTHRVGVWAGASGMVSSLLVSGLRLARIAAGSVFADIGVTGR
ncbi:hypothetical protein [Chromatocurvus halotolerans]|uniref:Uncharacterized protein n=1 Tax=Chromatocurvus halotolerans TaxID=1132028 RepID=A0A4R2KXF3_9GAMM|nr:hypothetical protein [Chromatocurvus halotolerans]TCO77567.1 hypothetical protein EV688_10224 [Chromatocurvus halotolerans]